MAQATDYSLADQSGAAFRAELNTILAAIASQNSGTSAPSTTYANMWWVDATTSRLKKRNNGNTTWIDLGPMDSFLDDARPVSSQSGGYTALAADRGKLIDFTAAATLALTAAATLGDGWFCAVRNSSSGLVVIDPNSSETVDGAATIDLPPGVGCLLVCDGSGFKTAGLAGIAGAFALTGTISPSQLTANTDDWAPTGLANAAVIRVSTDASRNLTGITGGTKGRVLVLHNVGSNPLVLKDDATSTAANRFALSGDITINADECVTLQYDATSSRWRVIGLSASTATGRLLAVQFLKSGTTYTRATGCVNALVVARGGGGAGGGAAATNGSAGGGGGQGGLSIKWIAPSASETYAIGAGGTAGSAGAAGNAGGNTTFGAHVTASGGSGGAAGTSSTGGAGGAGGAASSGDLNVPGEPGEGRDYFGSSGVALRGGQGGGEGAGLGAAPSAGAAGSAATANTGGGGGGGASGGSSVAGGAGGSGYIIVYEYS